MLNRPAFLQRVIDRREPWDIVVIGGGASGVGVAVDAAARGYAVLLLEQSDFGKGTSSRSTKLVHGGVRYLQQGNIRLVMDALEERGLLRQNAPHLVHAMPFVLPNYAWWEAPYYGIGLKVYDALSRHYSFGRSQWLGRDAVLQRIPTLEPTDLRGGTLYFDGQFDDARLLINLVTTAAKQGATVLNYARVSGFHYDSGVIAGVRFADAETGQTHDAYARCVINATGAFTDELRRLDDSNATPMVAASQGVHLVLNRSFLSGDSAIMIPRTRDGRVMFAIPWHGHVVLGTTDTPIQTATPEPRAMDEEIEFILSTAAQYLAKDPTRADVLSVFTGIRPLVKAAKTGPTAALSRDHTIQVSKNGLITLCGGKWTTYRKMAEDCVDEAAKLAKLQNESCTTRELKIHGYHTNAAHFGILQHYGADAPAIRALIETNPSLGKQLHESLPIVGAEVVWAVRTEMARTVEDVLARRTRALFLNAKAAIAMAPAVAELMAGELGYAADWQADQIRQFSQLAEKYLLPD